MKSSTESDGTVNAVGENNSINDILLIGSNNGKIFKLSAC